MNDNEILTPVPGQEETDDLDLLEEIKNLKANTVSKEEYQKQVEKNKALMRQIIEGGGTNSEPEETVNIEDLRNEIFNNSQKLSNLDFWKKVLTLREERLKEGIDPFLPKGKKTVYTRQDVEAANHVAEVIEHCIEESEDNPAIFTALLNNAIN